MPSPRYPIYVVSRGRAHQRMTVKALTRLGVDFLVIIEADERKEYAAVIDPTRLLILDPEYQRSYDPFDEHGMTRPLGPGPARNMAWEHSIAAGHEAHWVMDDNIRAFYRFHHSKRLYAETGTILWVMEEWFGRYENVAMVGPEYVMFAPEKGRRPPLKLNTRVYSCNLIRNDLPYRWRGRYNEDTDLSLRMLKDGWVTALFNAFLQEKLWTRQPGRQNDGGNRDVFYRREGTLPKSRMLVRMHPDVAELVWKFQRWHHEVDYSRFAGNRPRLRDGVVLPDGPDEHGMRLVADRTPRSPRLREIAIAENALESEPHGP